MANNVSQIPPPRVPILDGHTNLVSREWFVWFSTVYRSLAFSTTSAPVTYTNDFIADSNNTWYIADKASSPCVVTLPTASTSSGVSLTFKTLQAQTVISAESNVVSVTGTVPSTLILSGYVGNWATLVSDGVNWVIMSSRYNVV